MTSVAKSSMDRMACSWVRSPHWKEQMDATAADADLEPPIAQVVEHADLFDQAERMMQREHVDAGAESQAGRALSHAGQEDVLGRGETVDGRRVMLGQVICAESRGLEALDLEQPLAIDAVEPEPRHWFYMSNTPNRSVIGLDRAPAGAPGSRRGRRAETRGGLRSTMARGRIANAKGA